MSKPNLLDLLKGTLQEIQQNNAQNPNEETTDPSIFDFIKDQLSEVDKKTKSNIQDNRGNNVGIFDLILDKITNAQKQNKENSNNLHPLQWRKRNKFMNRHSLYRLPVKLHSSWTQHHGIGVSHLFK